MRRFLASLQKNARNLLRNWTTLSVIFIGPFLLLMILVIAYSNDLHGVQVGYVEDALAPSSGGNSVIIGKSSVVSENSLFPSSWSVIKMGSLSDCYEKLKAEKVHLCVYHSDKGVEMFYDPAREEVGIILIADIRHNLALLEEQRIRSQTGEVLDDIRSANYFFEQSKNLGKKLQGDLSNADASLVTAQDQIVSARANISTQLVQLAQTRERLVYYNGSIQNPYLNNIALTRANLAGTRNQLVWLQNQAGQNAAVKVAIAQAIAQIDSADLTLLQADGDLRSAQTDLAAGIANIDSARESLVNADKALAKTSDEIVQARVTIQDRQEEVSDLLTHLDEEQAKFSKIGNRNVDDLVGFKQADIYSVDQPGQVSPRQGDIKYKVPTILAMLAMFVSIILSNILFQEEVHGKAYLRNRLMRFRGNTVLFIGSLLLTAVFITLLESLLFLVIAHLSFSFGAWSLMPVMFALFLMISVYCVFGLIIGYFISDKASSLLACVFFILINILLGGIFVPAEKIIFPMSTVSQILPISSTIEVLEENLFHGVVGSSVTGILWYLALILVVSLIVLVIVSVLRRPETM